MARGQYNLNNPSVESHFSGDFSLYQLIVKGTRDPYIVENLVFIWSDYTHLCTWSFEVVLRSSVRVIMYICVMRWTLDLLQIPVM